MFIKKIKINQYKSIKKPMVLDLLPINILIGQNNCGKSNILDALEYAFNKNLDKSNLFYPQADVFIEGEHQGQEFILSLKNGQRNLSTPTFLKKLRAKIKRLNEGAFVDYQQIEKDYKSLFDYPESLHKFKKHLKNHFPKITLTENAMDIKYQKEGLYEGQRRVTMDYLGSGFGRIFTMLLYIFHPDYTVVMIDEPETHLHPALIKKLLWAMENANAGQIIFTTHSPLFITPATLLHLFRINKERGNTNAYVLEKGSFNYDKLIKELNADNLEMFLADKVLLVEGISDKLIIQGLIKKFYKGNKEIKVIQAYGKSNTNIYADLLKIFKIPFLIILDRDALKGYYLEELINHLNIKLKGDKRIENLKKYNLYIFPNGSLEANYPGKYQKDKSKAANALSAANSITAEDFNSKKMKYLKEIIESI